MTSKYSSHVNFWTAHSSPLKQVLFPLPSHTAARQIPLPCFHTGPVWLWCVVLNLIWSLQWFWLCVDLKYIHTYIHNYCWSPALISLRQAAPQESKTKKVNNSCKLSPRHGVEEKLFQKGISQWFDAILYQYRLLLKLCW